MRPAIEKALGEVEIAFTKRTGHGIALAEEGAKAGHTLVVAVGGDGTFNEVVNGLMRAGKAGVEVGIIGQGTGGDFRKSVGLEHRLDAYLAALAKGDTRALDVARCSYRGRNGEAEERWVANIVSCGIGGLVDQYVATSTRAFGGTAAYFGAGLRALVNGRLGRLSVRVTSGGETREHKLQTYLLAVCNGRYFGSGMMVAPMADIGDGKLEIVSMGPRSKLAFAVTQSAIYKGEHLQHPDAVHLAGQKVEIMLDNDDAKERFLIDLDGEPVGGLPMTVEIVPGALRMRA